MVAAMRSGNPAPFLMVRFLGQQGFTYIGLLLYIALSGIALATIGQVWHTEIQRDKEQELIFIGQQYSQAIGSYFQNGPANVHQYPASLQDLLVDSRTPVIHHHLRKLYRDPFSNNMDWGLIKQQGRIIGIYSMSKLMPLKRTGFPAAYEGFDQASSYAYWHFTFSALNNQTLGSAATPAPLTSDGSADANNAVSDSKPIAAPSPPRDAYAACAKLLDADNAACLASCGQPEGKACRTCYSNAFASYRSCLSGQAI